MRPDRRRQGSVLRAGDQFRPTTADQRFLEPPRGTQWTREDPWRVLRIHRDAGRLRDSVAHFQYIFPADLDLIPVGDTPEGVVQTILAAEARCSAG